MSLQSPPRLCNINIFYVSLKKQNKKNLHSQPFKNHSVFLHFVQITTRDVG